MKCLDIDCTGYCRAFILESQHVSCVDLPESPCAAVSPFKLPCGVSGFYQSADQSYCIRLQLLIHKRMFVNRLVRRTVPKKSRTKAISLCHYRASACLSFKTNLLRQSPSCPEALFVIGALDININCSFTSISWRRSVFFGTVMVLRDISRFLVELSETFLDFFCSSCLSGWHRVGPGGKKNCQSTRSWRISPKNKKEKFMRSLREAAHRAAARSASVQHYWYGALGSRQKLWGVISVDGMRERQWNVIGY